MRNFVVNLLLVVIVEAVVGREDCDDGDGDSDGGGFGDIRWLN